MALTDIPIGCRGTIRFDGRAGQPWHYRLDQWGQLMVVKGEDPRDWTAIDRGALDYSKIAAQEHATEGFNGHVGGPDGAIGKACHLCGTGEDVITAATRRLAEARKAGRDLANGQTVDAPSVTAPVTGPVPTHLDPGTARDVQVRQLEAELAESRAALENQAKKKLGKPAKKVRAGSVDARCQELGVTKYKVSKWAKAQGIATNYVSHATLDAYQAAHRDGN